MMTEPSASDDDPRDYYFLFDDITLDEWHHELSRELDTAIVTVKGLSKRVAAIEYVQKKRQIEKERGAR